MFESVSPDDATTLITDALTLQHFQRELTRTA